jgi:hypothetical protein
MMELGTSIFDWIVPRFLTAKQAWSRKIAATFQRKRLPLPAFNSLEEIEWYRLEHFRYRNDPLFGVLDYYQHPEHLMVSKRGDCDCQATWVYQAAQSLAGHQAEIITVVTWQIWKNHVFCAISTPDGRLYSIDTRGLHPHEDRQDMLAYYNRAFRTRYRPYHTDYPFTVA